ncbi:MAG TPA: type IV pili methyl-accepting chemotaxis transducer N-terminal domain-containing protein [Piscinibacter sp.]|nr:type IV pili methyl-accepting chemotaxis transducer N-terminal domain-containing protein [Piscinibacter sp.]
MKSLFRTLFVLLALLAAAAQAGAQISDINAAVNKAGRQRMLSQRLAKLYLQIGQDVDAERSRRLLDASLALFDRQLVELKTYAPSAPIKESVQKLEKSWAEYKDLLAAGAPNPANARKVMALSDEVLALAQQLTAQLEKLAGTPASRLVNVAGRERMLSQRMSKLYQARAWNVAPEAGAAELEQLRREFLAGLAELEEANANTPALREALALGRQQWLFFDAALKGQGSDKRGLATHVATTSERILEVMDSVTGMYEKAPK